MSYSSLSEVAAKECEDEITDYTVYTLLSRIDKNPQSKVVFSKLREMEHRHYEFWRKYCNGVEARPSWLTIRFILFLWRIMGSSFVIKYLERKEASTIRKYEALRSSIPAEDQGLFDEIIGDEKGHEISFAEQVQGSYVRYISFVVLGLADALVEIAGIHAGSLGIYASTELTGLAGVVAGAAASLAMASAAFAQAKQGFQGSARIAASYTGISYFVSALILAVPYFLTRIMLTAIIISLVFGVLIIAFVSWYNSVISGSHFKTDFGELAGIMLGATLALYIFGTIIRALLGITI